MNTIITSLATIATGMIALRRAPSQRWPYILPFTISAYLSAHFSQETWSNDGYSTLFSFGILYYYAHMIAVLYIHKVTLTTSSLSESWYHQGNVRWLSTPRCVVQQSTISKQTISRPKFLLSQLGKVFLTYLIFCMYHDLLDFPLRYRLKASDFDPHKSSLVRPILTCIISLGYCKPQIQARDIVIRLWCLSKWILEPMYISQTIHQIFSIFFVGLAIDSPDQWPPLFGSFKDATSMRKYWSDVWHRCFYRVGLTYSNLLYTHIFRGDAASRSPTSRFARNSLVFFISGVMHLMFNDLEWPYFWWFAGQPALFIVEEAIMKVCHHRYGMHESTRWTRGVGRCWVALFMFWSVPKVLYPEYRVRYGQMDAWLQQADL